MIVTKNSSRSWNSAPPASSEAQPGEIRSSDAKLYSVWKKEKIFRENSLDMTARGRTDANLKILIEKVSYLSILKAMHASSGIKEAQISPKLLRIVDAYPGLKGRVSSLEDEASRKSDGQPLSIWKLFTAHYGEKMGLWGQIKVGGTYLFLWKWTSIFPKTVDGYLKNLLSELRVHLKENGEKREKFIDGIIEEIDHFLEIYNSAAETYAHDPAGKGDLTLYRKAAIDLNLPAKELSRSIIDNFSPKISFRVAENWLNSKIRNVLKNAILPDLFRNLSITGQEDAQRRNIPLFLALTKALIQQIPKLEQKLEQRSPNQDASFSLSRIKNFEGIVKKLMRSIDLADCKTPEEVKARLALLEVKQKTSLDGIIRAEIEEGIQKGLAATFDYLSKQENTEELFALLCEAASAALFGTSPIDEEEWKTVETEYTGARIGLKQSVSTLFDRIVKKEIRDALRSGSDPKAADHRAGRIGGGIGAFLGSSLAALGGCALGSSCGGPIGAGVGGFVGMAAAYSVQNLNKIATKKEQDLALENLGAATIGGLATGCAAFLLSPIANPILLGATVTSAGLGYAGTKLPERAADAGAKKVVPVINNIFDKAYDHLVTNEIVIDSGLKILMKQIIALFPPKN